MVEFFKIIFTLNSLFLSSLLTNMHIAFIVDIERKEIANKWSDRCSLHCTALQDVSSCICTCFGIYRGIYTSWRLYSGVVGVVRGAILSAEAPPIISQLAADCVQSPIELRAAPVNWEPDKRKRWEEKDRERERIGVLDRVGSRQRGEGKGKGAICNVNIQRCGTGLGRNIGDRANCDRRSLYTDPCEG